jgi:hypothetical protein
VNRLELSALVQSQHGYCQGTSKTALDAKMVIWNCFSDLGEVYGGNSISQAEAVPNNLGTPQQISPVNFPKSKSTLAAAFTFAIVNSLEAHTHSVTASPRCSVIVYIPQR